MRVAGRFVAPLALMGLIFFLSHQPELATDLGLLDLIGRKIVHAAEYALLCFLWWRLLREAMPSEQAALVAFVVAVAYAATDEYHQSFVDGRNGTPVDVLIDAAGVLIGILVLERRFRSP